MADGRTYPSRPVLAVSAAVIRGGKVLIVRRARPPAHGLYTLPGGGVEVGESVLDALKRELMEEGRIELAGQPAFLGIFFNRHISVRDHVAVYVVRHYRQDRLPEPNHEITACGFFAPDALPEGTTPGTRLRIAEVLEAKPPLATWR